MCGEQQNRTPSKSLTEGSGEVRLDLFLVHRLWIHFSKGTMRDIEGTQTLLPVATELVGSRPAYKGYLPLWCSVWLAAVKMRGPTYVQAPLLSGSSCGEVSKQRRNV